MIPIPSIRTTTAATRAATRTATSTRSPKWTLRSIEPAAIPANDPRGADRATSNRRIPEALDSPRAYYSRERTYFLRDSELETLTEVGTFRVIAAPDLAHFGYGGDTARMEREIRRLKHQSLLSEKPGPGVRNKPSRLLALTKRGSRLVRKSGRVSDDQAIYYGFRKPREAKHDADLYRLYQAQATRIRSTGGRPVRVVLDYELKRNLNRDLAALDKEGRSPEALEQIAERHGLAVVNGKIPVPDLRIEYDIAADGTGACRPGACNPQLPAPCPGRKGKGRLFSLCPP